MSIVILAADGDWIGVIFCGCAHDEREREAAERGVGVAEVRCVVAKELQ